MKKSGEYFYTEIRRDIWQIQEDKSVCCTLIKGRNMAILVDTGYGVRNIRAFVENNVETPYMVINSHGHPDHIGGNHWFDEVYAVREEWDVISHFERLPEGGKREYALREIRTGDVIDLGGLHCEVISARGHTKASCGILVREEKLLVSGDAMNEGLWLFNYGSLSMKELHDSLLEVMKADFDTYLCGHSHEEYGKMKITAHIENIENLKVDESTLCDTIGFQTYVSNWENRFGKSSLVFTEDVLS